MADISEGNGIRVTSEKQNRIDSRSPSDHLKSNQMVKDYSQSWLNQMEQKQAKINALLQQANKLQENSSKAQQNALERQKTVLQEQLIIMEKMKVTGSATVEQQLDVDKKIAEVYEAVAQKQYEIAATNEKTSKKQKKAMLEAKLAAEAMAKATKESLKDIEKAVDNIQEDLLGKVSGKMEKFSKDLMQLSNTINIDKIANTLTGGDVADKISIMNNTKASFGMTSNREFEDFKNGLMQRTEDLNDTVGQAMFGAKDVRMYMSNLTKLGIDSTKIAQEQLKATLIGNKYLGLSEESQGLMIEQIKKNGDSTLMTKQNNKIVALLNSQIGLSKEQLDSMTKAKFSNADAIANLGPAAYEKYMSSFDAGDAALKAAFGDNVAASVNNIFSDLLMNGTSSQYIQNGSFGNAAGMLQAVQSGDYQGFINQLMNDSQFKSVMNALKTNNNSGEIRQQLGITGDMSSIANAFFGENRGLYSEKLNAANKAVGGASDKETNNWLSSIYVSLKDRVSNFMSLKFDQLPWSLYFSLANAAFGLYIGSKALDAGKWLWEKGGNLLKGIKDAGGLKNFISGKWGAIKGFGSKLLTGIKSIPSGISKFFTTGAGGKAISGITGFLGKSVGTGAAANGGIGLAGSAGLTVGTAAAGIAGTAVLVADGVKGYKKSKEWLGSDSAGAKVSSTIGGALGGTGPGLADEGSAVDKAKNIGGNALKGAGIGAAIGSIIPGVGTAIGAAVGGAVGAIGGAIGGEKISKAIKGVGDFAGKTFKKAGDFLVTGWDNYKKKGEKTLKGVAEFGKKALDGINNFAENNDGVIAKGLRWLGFGQGGGDISSVTKAGFGMGGGQDLSHNPPITAGYPTYPSGGRHRGIDFGVKVGTAIGSAHSGTVVSAVNDNKNTYPNGPRTFGSYVLIKGNNGKYFRYGHLSRVDVKPGDIVSQGQQLGLSGNSGYSSGPHLHFQAQTSTANTSDVSPYPYINDSIFTIGKASTATSSTNSSSATFNEVSTESAMLSLSKGARYVPKGFGIGGVSGSSKAYESASYGAADKIIAKLDELASRQDEQAAMLQAFSMSNSTPKEFGGAYA